MKLISKKPLCFTVSMKEIESNNIILSPLYYADKAKHKEYNEWFSGLTLKQKDLLKSYHNFIEEDNIRRINKYYVK